MFYNGYKEEKGSMDLGLFMWHWREVMQGGSSNEGVIERWTLPPPGS